MNAALSFQKILALLLGFIGSLITVRYFYSGEPRFFFLVWNLFLAWVPLAVCAVLKNSKQHWAKQTLLFLVWLLFFPNGLYVVTDLVHLNSKSSVPVWFDAVLLFSAAITSLIMAFASLLKMEVFLLRRFTENTVQWMIMAILFLGSFGVYLGRFLRWNSWDIVNSPVELMGQVAHRLLFPLEHGRTWSTTLVLAVFFYLLWLVIKKMPGHLNRAAV
jgi:uncharacterized membrane protein